jgi:hypothetical protein
MRTAELAKILVAPTCIFLLARFWPHKILSSNKRGGLMCHLQACTFQKLLKNPSLSSKDLHGDDD